MKVLFINNGSGVRKGLGGGTERLLQLCALLRKKDVDIHIITASEDKDYFDEMGLKPYRSIQFNPLAFFTDNKLTRSLWYGISIFTTLFFSGRARRSDIIYSASDYIYDVMPAICLSILFRKHFVVFIHHECRPPSVRKGIYIINFMSYWTQRLSYAIIKRFAARIFFYDTDEGHHIANYFSGCNVAFGLNGIDPSFHMQSNNKDPLLALFAGGLRPSKGIEGLIDVWEKVVHKHPSATLKIAGGGDAAYTAFIRNKIEKLGLAEHIILMGSVDKSSLAREYEKSSLYLSCSHEEGWGISIYQALAAGLEVFAYDLPCFTRITPYCHLYAQEDAAAMAAGIIALLEGSLPRKALTFPAEQHYWQNVLEYDLESLKAIV